MMKIAARRYEHKVKDGTGTGEIRGHEEDMPSSPKKQLARLIRKDLLERRLIKVSEREERSNARTLDQKTM